MKRALFVLLQICLIVVVFASCGHSETLVQTIEEASVTDYLLIGKTTMEETTTEEMATETSAAEETSAQAAPEETTLEPAPDEWADWQKKALAVMQSVEVECVSELTGIVFTLQDLSQDGIPEIIEELHYIEWYDGPEAIWTWYNGDYTLAYAPSDDLQINSISAYRNKTTGRFEIWDLGNLDFELKDYYPESPNSGGISEVFGPYEPINSHINRLEFQNGKLRIAESHDELKNFATYGMPDEQVEQAWEALHEYSRSFWKTHDREPVTIHSISLKYLDFEWQFGLTAEDKSKLLSENDLPPDRRYYGNDYYSNLDSTPRYTSYIYNRDHLRKIIEDY